MFANFLISSTFYWFQFIQFILFRWKGLVDIDRSIKKCVFHLCIIPCKCEPLRFNNLRTSPLCLHKFSLLANCHNFLFLFFSTHFFSPILVQRRGANCWHSAYCQQLLSEFLFSRFFWGGFLHISALILILFFGPLRPLSALLIPASPFLLVLRLKLKA